MYFVLAIKLASMNNLYYGDNLDVLRRHIANESVDLIYLDPPFKSDQNYNVLFADQDGTRSAAQIQAFEDTWRWDRTAAATYQEVVESGGSVSLAMQAFRKALGDNDMLAYLSMMAPRLVELRRVLRSTGSIYLHCDPTASHYLKVLLDSIFGPEQFRNEIIWRRTGSHNSARRFGPIHDVILFFTKSNDYFFNTLRLPYLAGHVAGYFNREDERGKYWTNALTGAGTREGSSGRPWRNYDPTARGRHWAIPGRLLEGLSNSSARLTSQEKLDLIDAAGFVRHPPAGSNAMPTYVQYLDDSSGIPCQDIWAYQPHTHGALYGTDDCIDEDVRWFSAQGDPERLGYPTQKPVGLLTRIVHSSCPESGVVLDPFCGCGTTIAAARKLGRAWIGIDITHLAISLIKHRLANAFGEKVRTEYQVIGEPTDVGGARQLAADDPHQFQWWALGLVGARPSEQKKGADRGIDGRVFFHDDVEGGRTQQIVLSVKSGKTSVPHVRDLRGVIERENAAVGVLITLQEPTKQMRSEAAGAGFYESRWGAGTATRHPRMQILTIEELLRGKAIDMPPTRDVRTHKKAPRMKSDADNKQRRLL